MWLPSPSAPLALALLFAVVAPSLLPGQGPRSTTPVQSAAEVPQLIAILESTTTSHHDKALACHRLAVLGPVAAVPALAGLLADEKLSHLARHALEPMLEPAAGDALREALLRLQGPLLIGVINSLGFRREAQATAALGQLLDAPATDVASAAATALGRIGTPTAAALLPAALGRASGPRRLAFADACLSAADALVASAQTGAAIPLYDLLSGPEFPPHLRTAAMRGAILSRGSHGLPLLVQQIKGNDSALLAAAWLAARELPGTAVTRALAAEFSHLPAAKQVLLLQVFGDRGDPAALPTVLAAATQGAPPVRVAALPLLPRLDDGRSALPVLLAAATGSGSPDETGAALGALTALPGKAPHAALLAALAAAPPPLQARLIGVLGARRADAARPELLRHAQGAEAEVARAALRALALVGHPTDLPVLIRISAGARDDSLKVPADLALYAVSMRIQPPDRRADPVLQAVRTAPDSATRAALLRPLGAIVKANGGSPEIMDTIRVALDDQYTPLRQAALRLLADWPDATPAPLLLAVATRAPDAGTRELALRGGSRMAANVATGVDATALDPIAWFTAAHRLVQTEQEKLLIIAGLGHVKRIEALRLLQPHLDDPVVQAEAALAVIAIAPALAATPDVAQVRQALDKILATTKDTDIRRKAGKAAKSLPARKK